MFGTMSSDINSKNVRIEPPLTAHALYGPCWEERRPDAWRAARLHRDGLRVWMEPPIGDNVRAALTDMGHQISNSPTGWEYGSGQAIVQLPRGYVAGSDPRQDGAAVGH